MDGESEKKVIAMHMNRPNPGLKEILNLGKKHPSPAEIGEDTQPHEADQAGDPPPGTDTAHEAGEPDHRPPAKKSDPLPKPGDAYRACARFLNGLSVEQRFLHFVTKDFVSEGFAYSDLRRLRWVPGTDPGSGPAIELRFVESVTTDVRIEGRNLDDIHYRVAEGTMPWVCEQPRGFKTKDDNAVVITGFSFDRVDKETGERVAQAGGNGR
jgi:hypothetical protein